MSIKPKTYFEQEVDRLVEKNSLKEYQYIQVRQSKAFMEKYHAENIDVEKISGAAFMSRFHFIRIFRQIYGVTPRQFLRDLRISKAKKLLKAGLPVNQVCFDVGYESLPTFSNTFKRSTGYSPKEYQKMYNSNPE